MFNGGYDRLLLPARDKNKVIGKPMKNTRFDTEKTWGPGWSYFHCEPCGYRWSEKSRDCTSPSGDSCPNCHVEFVSPYGNEPHPEWEVDSSRNLVHPEIGDEVEPGNIKRERSPQ